MKDSTSSTVDQDGHSEETNLLIKNKSAEANKFEPPKPVDYSVGASILSILSLFLLGGLSAYYYKQIQDYPLWVVLPFIFTIFGAGIGALLELGLLFSGTPFQLTKNSWTRFITRIRLWNLGPLMSMIFFFVMTMVVEDANTRIACLFLAFFMGSALSVALYYGGAEKFLPLIILGVQLLQLTIVLASGEPFGAHWKLGLILIAQALFQTAAFVVTTATPMKSTGFHVLSSVSGTLLYFAVLTMAEINPEFATELAPNVSLWSVTMWGLVATVLAGIVYTMKASPMTYSNWRVGVSNLIWGTIYFELISQKRFPYPVNLTELYGPVDGKQKAPEPSVLQPYYQQHPEFLPERLSVPAVEKVEGNVNAFGELVKKVKMVFKVIAMLDHYFPQANINIPLKDKPRMPIWSDGKEFFPGILNKRIFGKFLPSPRFKETPKPAIKAYKEGQLLAYLAESGIANPFLKKTEDGTGRLVIDLRFLEKYEFKKDYEPYGGLAYFKIDKEEKRLKLVSVVAPRATQEIEPNPMDANFRHAESMVLASIYFQVISGKHLSDIHMTYNLLEVVLHNAFDAKKKYNHPLRTFMYIHLFSHELAEEFTTEHLVQEGAVFTQIFATTHHSLINHLNECYSNFEYASDEDFDYRKEIMTITTKDCKGETKEEIIPNACIKWELEYRKIWTKYTDQLINTIYESDEAVEKDEAIADMYKGMNEVFLNGLPKRYGELKTKAELSRWASDTIHHLIIRHQVYGTTGINAAMDPRISSTQVPTDGGTPGINEWRSLMSVGLATACARFTLLLGGDDSEFKKGQDPKFLYLLKGVDEKYVPGMTKAFNDLHDDLNALDKEWTNAETDGNWYNVNYFRAKPSDLRTGPGY